MSVNPAIACLLAIALLMSGCLGEDIGGGVTVINKTSRKLFIFDKQVPANGGTWGYATNDCSDTDLVARTKDGSTYVTLTEELCSGQTWTITGPGRITLTVDR